MTAALYKRTFRGLEPADANARQAMSKIKVGQVVSCEVKRPRNVQHHRKWWALCSLVAENLDDVAPETVCDVLKIRSGHVRVVKTAKGEVVLPRSISFAQLDQQGFDEFYERAVKVVLEDVIPGIDKDDLEAAVLEMMQ